jgi:osmotically inducible protein OsmC
MKKTASVVWHGGIKDGKGAISTQTGVLKDAPYGFASRFESGPGTNPEELLGAAHAGCFAMQFSAFLAENGTPADELNATATVEIIPGTGITSSALSVEAKVPGIDQAKFAELATKAKAECPVSRALGAINVTLDAKLV